MADTITVGKAKAGQNDIEFNTAGQAQETFQRYDKDKNLIPINKVRAAHIPFSAVALYCEDLVDGGYDLAIKPKAIGASGSIIPIADQSGKNLHDLFDGGYDSWIKPNYVKWKLVTKTSTYNATLADTIILVDATSGAVTINLPTSVGIESKLYIIKKIDSSANAVTIDANGAQTLDGDTTTVLYNQYDHIKFVSDNVNWAIISFIYGPAFSVYLSAQQDNITGTDQIEFDTEVYDTHGNFDTGAWRFTPKRAGKYTFHVYLNWRNVTAGDELFISHNKNGAISHSIWIEATALTNNIFGFSCDEEANGTTDYFEVFALNNDRNSSDIFNVATSTYYQGFKSGR